MQIANFEIPANEQLELCEPSVFSITINRWCGCDDSGIDSFVILLKDGRGNVVHREEFSGKGDVVK